jgi:malto-oligosyltrehalose trehalohydrolase
MDGHTIAASKPLFGANLQDDESTLFRIWAPTVTSLSIEFLEPDGTVSQYSVTAIGEGWFESAFPRAAGSLYRYVLPDGLRVPDPASRFQPQDTHGPSEVIDPTTYVWRNPSPQMPWHEAVIYEIHIGTFTPEGTFAAAAERLDHIAELGATAIEIMPVADFTGSRNWGYDGALLYAPDSTYGRPDDFKAFIDAAHERGLMVFLDVVYNHFGPDGNYLPVYACPFFTDRHKTPWGSAMNFDGPDAKPVREFIIGNALYWINEYRLDGLRLDAVHALIDDSKTHLLAELAQRVRASVPGVHLIIENEENEAHRLARDADGDPKEITAQWNDDVHHVLHVAATGERQGYYADYAATSDKLQRALAEGFAFQGEYMNFRGSARGEPSAHLSPTAFISFIQNHDQIGNRAFGERLSTLASEDALKAVAAVYLLAPQIPMLFMGEEWGARQPFTFFCDFHGELGESVRNGRREEFAKFPAFQDEAIRARIPDPQAASTFESAKLDWSDLRMPPHMTWLAYYQKLITLRRRYIRPLLPHMTSAATFLSDLPAGAIQVTWTANTGAELQLLANLSDHPVALPGALNDREPLFELGNIVDATLPAWFVRWTRVPQRKRRAHEK